MARRLIHIVQFDNVTAKVYRDSEWNEYRVTYYIDGVKQADADSHHDDKTDAMSTAVHAAGVMQNRITARVCCSNELAEELESL